MPNPLPDPAHPDVTTVEIWAKAPIGLPPVPGGYDILNDPTMAAEVDAAGKLDFDSNANCIIDGSRQENVVYPQMPPSGEYIVRVDAFSMCGQAAAQWEVTVTTSDGSAWVNPARWQATDTDTRGPHAAGAGRLAVDFQYP